MDVEVAPVFDVVVTPVGGRVTPVREGLCAFPVLRIGTVVGDNRTTTLAGGAAGAVVAAPVTPAVPVTGALVVTVVIDSVVVVGATAVVPSALRAGVVGLCAGAAGKAGPLGPPLEAIPFGI